MTDVVAEGRRGALTVGIVGCGVMGRDVALVCASAGHDVLLHDHDADVRVRLRADLRKLLRGYRLAGLDSGGWSSPTLLGRLRVVNSVDELAAASWIVENVVENVSVKEDVHRQLAATIGAPTRVAINTSCVPITRLATLYPDPDRVIGMHFMNPVPLVDAVEVIRGRQTSATTLGAAQAWLASLGKSAIVVNDSPGFVSNRLSHLFMNEAARVVEEGVAKPADIDAIFTRGYGHAMGPLATADLIGLDTVADSLDVLFSELGDPRFECADELRSRVNAGMLGRKSGRGFHSYDGADAAYAHE